MSLMASTEKPRLRRSGTLLCVIVESLKEMLTSTLRRSASDWYDLCSIGNARGAILVGVAVFAWS
jgi:hypothetical protein